MEQERRLDPGRIQEMPAELLAFLLLERFPADRSVHRTTLIERVLKDAAPDRRGEEGGDLRRAYPQATVALVEGFQRLMLDGLVVNWPVTGGPYPVTDQGEFFQLTRLGQSVRQAGALEGRAYVAARRRLGVELHPRLADQLRDLVAVGAFEQAATTALIAVEARVREMASLPEERTAKRLTGVPLMQRAFSPGSGPLADPRLDSGGQQALMNLFAGTFGLVRNTLVHTDVEWHDPVEAAEYVLLADLLMRLLDRTEAAGGGGGTGPRAGEPTSRST